jgi:sec-independent protein translocase protein TatA
MLAEIFGVDGVIVLIVVVVLLFGGAAIPKLARNLGSAKNEFEKGLQDGKGKNAASTSALTVNEGTGSSDATSPGLIRVPDRSDEKA